MQFLAAWIGVRLGRYQQQLIEYQREEIQILRRQLGGRRIRFTDAARRRLAVLGKQLGRKALGEVARWRHRTRSYGGTGNWWRRSTTDLPGAVPGDRVPLPRSRDC